MKATRAEKRALLETVERWAAVVVIDREGYPRSFFSACSLCRLAGGCVTRQPDCLQCVAYQALGAVCTGPSGAFGRYFNGVPTNESVLLTAILLCEIYGIDVEAELGWEE
jgi:hypothetical protein